MNIYTEYVAYRSGYVLVTHLLSRSRALREWEVYQKGTLLSLCLAKGEVGV
jgi:hypothetical protein